MALDRRLQLWAAPMGAVFPREQLVPERDKVHITKMEAVVSHNPALGATYTIAPLHSVGHTDQPCTLWMKNTEESEYREAGTNKVYLGGHQATEFGGCSQEE